MLHNDAPDNDTGPAAWALIAAFVVIYISWGTTYWPIRKAVHDEGLPPAIFGGSRIACAGLLLLGVQAVRGQSLRLTWRDLVRILASGSLLFLMANWLIALAQQRVESSLAAVLAATTPLWMGLFAFAWPGGDRLSRRGWLGLVVGLAGVVALLWPRLAQTGDLRVEVGPLLVLGSAAAWALGSLVLRHLPPRLPHLSAAGYQMLLGGGCQVLLGLALGEAQRLPPRLTAWAVGTFLYLLVVGSLLGFVAYNWLLGHVPAAKVGTYAYVNPVIALALGWLTGEEVGAGLLGGIAIILVGVYLVRDRPPLAA